MSVSRPVAGALIIAAIVIGVWLGTMLFAFLTGSVPPPPA